MHTLNSDPNIAKLQDYTIRALQGDRDDLRPVLWHPPDRRPDHGRHARAARLPQAAHAKARLLGLESEFVSTRGGQAAPPADRHRAFPWRRSSIPTKATSIPRASPTPTPRRPASRAPRSTASRRVVEIHRAPTAAGTWSRPGHLRRRGRGQRRRALGARGRPPGRRLSCRSSPMEHQYLVTEDIPEIVARGEELPHAIDFEAEIYIRQEGKGLLLGTYEQACGPWSTDTTPWRLRPRAAAARSRPHRAEPRGRLRRISRRSAAPASSASSTAPSPSRRTAIRWSARCRASGTYWVACGVMAGFSQGGGVGLALAEWIDRGRARHATSSPWTSPASATSRPRALHARQGPGELQPALLDRLPERGAAGRPAAEDHGDLRTL